MNELIPIPLPELIPGASNQREEEVEWLPASDHVALACRVWRARSEQAVILYLHGIEGHSQWFEPTASLLSERGLTVYALDRRGSGLNRAERGHLSSFQLFIADVENVLRKIALNHPGLPVFLFANCWSAKAAAVIARRNHRYVDRLEAVKLAGLVMTCPAIVTKVDFDLLTKCKIAFCAVTSESLKRRLWPIPLTTPMLTDNPVFLEFLERDPLRLKEASSQFFRETFVLGLLAQSAAQSISLPVLILQAGNDQIVDIAKLRLWFGRLASPDKQWRTFDRATHSLDFDPSWFNDYTNILSQWLIARTMMVAA